MGRVPQRVGRSSWWPARMLGRWLCKGRMRGEGGCGGEGRVGYKLSGVRRGRGEGGIEDVL